MRRARIWASDRTRPLPLLSAKRSLSVAGRRRAHQSFRTSHETRDPGTYRPGGEKDAEAETRCSPAEPAHAFRLRVRLVSGNPIFPRRSSNVRWRVRISLRRSLNDAAQFVHPLAGSCFRAIGVHASSMAAKSAGWPRNIIFERHTPKSTRPSAQ